MKRVSTAYKDAMKRTIQPFSHMRVTFDIVDSTIVDDTAISVDRDGTVWSDVTKVLNRVEDKKQYITFEPQFWRVGSMEQYILPDAGQSYVSDDYVSDILTDASGKFGAPPILTMSFGITHSILGFTFTFDDANETYPTQINVTAYRDGEPIEKSTIHPDSALWVWDHGIEEFDKLTMEFVSLNKPYNRLRLKNIMFGIRVVWTTKDIYESKHTTKIDPISSTLPTAKVEWSINNINRNYNGDNPTGIWAYLDMNQPVKIEYGSELDDSGEIEWLLAGHYHSQGAPEMDGLFAKFSAVDTLTNMDKTFNHGLYRPEGVTLYDLAEEVLIDADLEALPDGGIPWHLDESLRNIKTYAAIPRNTHKECLQLIANAGKCALYTDVDGRIRLILQEDPKITVSDNGGTHWSDSAAAFNEIEPVASQYITFEPNTWLIGGNRIVLPDEGNPPVITGYTSSAISGTNGVFGESPSITVHYSYAYHSNNLALQFGDPVPSEFRVQWYRDGVLLDTQDVIGNTLSDWTSDRVIPMQTDTVITILKMSKPNTRARVQKIGKGRVSDYYLDYTLMKQEPEVKKIPQLSEMQMDVHNYVVSPDASELYHEEELEVDGERTIEVTYQLSTNHNVVVTGGELVAAEMYAEYSKITVSGNGLVDVLLTGKTIEDSKSIVSVHFHDTGSPCPVDNPLITNRVHAADAGAWMGNYLQLRNSYSVDYREDFRIDVNDIIYQQSMFEGRFPVRVTKHVLNMPGQWGEIETRRLV